MGLLSVEGKTPREEIKSRKRGEELAVDPGCSQGVGPHHCRHYNGVWPFEGPHTQTDTPRY